MACPASGRRTGIFDRGDDRPAIVAHGAGNSRPSLEQALDAGADLIEVDLWVHRGRFESRHERRLPVPLLVDNWALRIPPREPLGFIELLDACKGRAGILMDLKNRPREAIELVRSSLHLIGQPAGLLLASSQSWSLLRGLRQACPEISALYSIDVLAQLRLYESISSDDGVPAGISCRHSLLDRGTVTKLHRRGLAVAAWTVDDPDRATELASWGVDAITTTATAELRPLFG
jgi:glycerophosphoryl diester phosphodiesterase